MKNEILICFALDEKAAPFHKAGGEQGGSPAGCWKLAGDEIPGNVTTK